MNPVEPDFLPAVYQQEMPSEEEVARLMKMAGFLAKGRMFKDVTQAEQAFSKMLIGYYLGLNPAQAMMGIQIVQGGISMAYPLMGAFIKNRKGYDYKIKEHDNDHAVIEFYKDDELLGTASFSVEDAKRARLVKEKGGWETFPENMCVARALSKGIRFFMPEALHGIPIYATGEVPEKQEDLSAPEGTGEAVTADVELPDEVISTINRARELEVDAWANEDTWKYRVKMGKEVLTGALLEAQEDLDHIEADRVSEAEVVIPEPDVPVDTEGLPDYPPPKQASAVVKDPDLPFGAEPQEDPTTGSDETAVAPKVSSPLSAPSTGGESEEMKILKDKLKAIQDLPANDADEQADKDEALAYYRAQILELEAQENPAQESLL